MTDKEAFDLQAELDKLTDSQRAAITALPRDIREIALKALLRAVKRETSRFLQEMTEEIGKNRAASQQLWAPCAPMPSDFCRCSPFFPLARAKMKEREYIRDLVITKSVWGEIHYTGVKLTVFEEDVLLGLLALLSQAGDRNEYHGPLKPLLRLLGYGEAGGKNYRRVLDAIDLLIGNKIKLIVYGKRKKEAKPLITDILSSGGWDEKSGELYVKVNEDFYELYARGAVTLLDVQQRSNLRTAIAKCLYRFVQSWDKPMTLHYMTLAPALNLDLSHPAREIRRQLKNAIEELIKHGILDARSGFISQNIVKLVRTPQSRVRRKLLTDEKKE
jgi:hypothetical protein